MLLEVEQIPEELQPVNYVSKYFIQYFVKYNKQFNILLDFLFINNIL